MKLKIEKLSDIGSNTKFSKSVIKRHLETGNNQIDVFFWLNMITILEI